MKNITRFSLALIMSTLFSISYLVTSASAQEGASVAPPGGTPAPAGMAIKAPVFIGDFWGKEREVHIGYQGPIQKVIRNEEYFIESVMQPMAKVAKGALAPMVIAPGLVNNEEVIALMAYVKSLSK